MKKIIIVFSIIIVIIAVAFGVYFAWQKSKQILEPPPINQQPIVDYQQQAITESKLRVLSGQSVFDYWLSDFATSSGIFYANKNGQIFKIADSRGGDELISDREIDNLRSIKANKNGSKIIVKYGNGDSVSSEANFEIFDLEENVWQPVENISAADFSPDGMKIAYLEKTSGNSAISNLAIRDLFGAKPKTVKIISINQEDFDLKWLSENKILLVSKPSNSFSGEIWEVDVKTKTVRFFAGGRGLALGWARDGSLGFKYSISGTEPSLRLIDNGGKAIANLDYSTLPEKCFISLSRIFCAVFKNFTDLKPLLPDDYLKRAVYSEDAIYEMKIDVQKKLFESSEIFIGKNAIDAVHFDLSGDKLIFINRYDDKIYGLTL